MTCRGPKIAIRWTVSSSCQHLNISCFRNKVLLKQRFSSSKSYITENLRESDILLVLLCHLRRWNYTDFQLQGEGQYSISHTKVVAQALVLHPPELQSPSAWIRRLPTCWCDLFENVACPYPGSQLLCDHPKPPNTLSQAMSNLTLALWTRLEQLGSSVIALNKQLLYYPRFHVTQLPESGCVSYVEILAQRTSCLPLILPEMTG